MKSRFAGWIRTACAKGLLIVAASLAVLMPARPALAAETKPADPLLITGKVIETMDAGGYTYVQVDTGKQKVWAAGPKTAVKVGEQVSFADGVPMRNYQSKTLNRTFESIQFVGAIMRPGQAESMMNPHGGMGGDPHAGIRGFGGAKATAVTDFSGLKKPEGGLTVAEVYAKRDSLAAKKVTVRGKVVKYNAEIMGKNWLHLRDGTGAEGSNDLLITSAKTAKVGDTVLISGTLALKKDFGFGYKYEVLVEDAEVVVEPPAKK